MTLEHKIPLRTTVCTRINIFWNLEIIINSGLEYLKFEYLVLLSCAASGIYLTNARFFNSVYYPTLKFLNQDQLGTTILDSTNTSILVLLQHDCTGTIQNSRTNQKWQCLPVISLCISPEPQRQETFKTAGIREQKSTVQNSVSHCSQELLAKVTSWKDRSRHTSSNEPIEKWMF